MKLEPASFLASHRTGRQRGFADRNLRTRKKRPAGDRLAIEQHLDSDWVALRADEDLIDPHDGEQVLAGGRRRKCEHGPVTVGPGTRGFHVAPMAIFVRGGAARRSQVDDIAQRYGKDRIVLGVITEERTHGIFGGLPAIRVVEAVLANSRAAFSNMRGEGGFGGQQELAYELPEKMVAGIDDNEIRDAALEGIAAL